MNKYLVPLWISLCICKMGIIVMAPVTGFGEKYDNVSGGGAGALTTENQ